ncbi:MAG: Ribonuclease D [Alphaproteobacteria bacterium ADurb.Bin438]|nr:MAG: Ribonuclease D [Alphaproteobacteria bacterium ADurb.Bin438]
MKAIILYKKNMKIITDNKSLKKFCKSLDKQKFITLDTEFVREKTFFPHLCLIQIGTARKSVVIDVLSEIDDYSPLKDILINESIVKVFHSARQDLEAFYNLLKIIPKPLFDTQIAAMALGFGDSVSYQFLVQYYCKVALNKGQRLTDWTKRPLTDEQIDYALSDVTYLIKVYKELDKKLTKLNRNDWIKDEMDYLISIDNYDINLDNAWERLKAKSSSKQYIANLQALAKFRDATAMKLDKPRKYIVPDETLLEIALVNPKDEEGLKNIRSVQRKSDGSIKYGEEILDLLKNSDFENIILPQRPSKEYLTKLSKLKPLTDMLKLLLNLKCSEAKVSSKLVANHDDIDDIAVLGIKSKSKVLEGWRLDFFGKDALLLRAGKLTICYDNIKNKIVTEVKL